MYIYINLETFFPDYMPFFKQLIRHSLLFHVFHDHIWTPFN